MIHSLVRVTGAALVSSVLLANTASAQTAASPKLDETLRESVDRGCYGGRLSVIITVEPGYREALRQALAEHGDVVTGEFPAINAIAADIHCDDLETLAEFGSIRAVSTNATVGVSAAKPARLEKLARELEGVAAKALNKNAFASLGASKFRDIKPNSLMLVPAEQGLTNDVTSTSQSSLKHTGFAGNGIGVAVIDSGIEPGTDFDDRITAFYDFTRGGIKAVSPHDDYGHGSHVAGLIASEFVGVAPYARLIGGQTPFLAPADCLVLADFVAPHRFGAAAIFRQNRPERLIEISPVAKE